MVKPKNKRPFFSYSDESMQKAVEAVKNGVSKKKAAIEFNVPRSTLVRKVSGRVSLVRKMGPSSELSEAEEKTLVEWLIAMARKGFPVHKNNLIQSVKKYLTESERTVRFLNDSKTPGRAWFEGFLRRHPEIKQRHVESLSKARAAVTIDRIQTWFDEIENFFKEEEFEDVLADPTRIFNADEAGFLLCPKSGKVLGPAKLEEDFYERVSSEKEQITVMGAFSADGRFVPPMLIFPYKKMPKAIVESVPTTWALGRSDSGWINSEVFFEYIANHFLPYVKSNNITRPVALFVDGHRSHLTQQVSKFCDENGVILIALFPNTTHIMQPADVSVFKPLKAGWTSAVRDWKFENFPKDVTRHTFGTILKDVFEKFALPKTIQNGFRKSGLFPFDKNNVDYSKCIPNRVIQRNNGGDVENTRSNFSQRVLETVEAKIPKETIRVFLTTYRSKSNWEGNIESCNLYQVWCALKDDCFKPQLPVTAEDDMSLTETPKTVQNGSPGRTGHNQMNRTPKDLSQPSTSVSTNIPPTIIESEDTRQKTPSPLPSTSAWQSPCRSNVYNYGMKENEGFKVPTPFKTCLPYPKTPDKNPPPKRKRKVFPFVVSCGKYRDFYENTKKKSTTKETKKPQVVRSDSSSDSDVEFQYADEDIDPMSDSENSIQLVESNHVIVHYENKYYPGKYILASKILKPMYHIFLSRNRPEKNS